MYCIDSVTEKTTCSVCGKEITWTKFGIKATGEDRNEDVRHAPEAVRELFEKMSKQKPVCKSCQNKPEEKIWHYLHKLSYIINQMVKKLPGGAQFEAAAYSAMVCIREELEKVKKDG